MGSYPIMQGGEASRRQRYINNRHIKTIGTSSLLDDTALLLIYLEAWLFFSRCWKRGTPSKANTCWRMVATRDMATSTLADLVSVTDGLTAASILSFLSSVGFLLVCPHRIWSLRHETSKIQTNWLGSIKLVSSKPRSSGQ